MTHMLLSLIRQWKIGQMGLDFHERNPKEEMEEVDLEREGMMEDGAIRIGKLSLRPKEG